MALGRVFDSHDTELRSKWQLDDSGIVTLVIPELGEIRMSLAKAEDLSASIARQAEYGRLVAEITVLDIHAFK